MAEKIIIAYLVIVNIVAFILMAVDKGTAVSNSSGVTHDKIIHTKHQRIPEATLMLVGLLLGALGGCIGMKVFHHKTKKPKFFIGMPLLLLLNIVAMFLIFKYLI